MAKLAWDQVGERRYETGTDRGVLYIPTAGEYTKGYAWNGLTTVTEAPSGAEPNAQYADNIKYLNLMSAEEFGGTIEAFTYPDEFGQCDGTFMPTPGVLVGQQSRKTFGLSYRTLVGNDVYGSDFGYKIHLVYGALAAPSEKAYSTVNDSPEALTFSWEFTTTPVSVEGIKPTAIMTVDSTKVNADDLKALEDILYGTVGTNPRLPLPEEVLSLFQGSTQIATPVQPQFEAATGTVTIPTTTGIIYKRADTNAVVTDPIVLSSGESVVIVATPAKGYILDSYADDDWQFTRA